MKEFLKGIIPRIQQYSKGLDKIEVFAGKNEPWIYIDENRIHHQYIFMRDKRLIMSFNGTVKTGTWELLPTNQLLINRISDEILLEHLFVEKALLILKRSGTEDLPFVLISKEEIPDLDVETYLEKFESEKEKKHVSFDEQKYRLFSSGEISGPLFFVGKIIETNDGKILNGTYKTTKTIYQEFVTIENNKITRVFYKVKYTYNKNFFIIEQTEFSEPNKGDKILQYQNLTLPQFKYFDITDPNGNKHFIKCNDTGNVIAIKNNLMNFFYFYLGIILILSIFIIIANI